MKKLTKSTGSIMIVLMLMKGPVLAEPIGNQLQSNQNYLKEEKSTLKNVKGNYDNIEQDIEKLDDQIGSLSNKIDGNKKLIIETEKGKVVAEKEVKDSEDKLEKSKEIANKRVRAMYINGVDGYLELLLGANSISDFISRVEIINKIVGYDKKIIKETNEKKDEANKRKVDLQTQEDKLIALNKDNENKITELNADKQTQKNLAFEAKKQERLLALNVSTSQEQVNAALKQISDIRKSTSKVTLSRGAVSFSTSKVIAYASNFLGTPYLWGGTSPISGFDCSGFTKYVFAHFGIGLGRTTYDQIKEGVEVSRDQLQPGDLVFFGTWSDPHHMGIYLGNNTYIHAPHTGDVVKVSAMTRTDFVTARRIR